MASSGLLKPDTFTIVRALLIGWKQIFATAQDETKRFSSLRLGARRLMTTAKSCLKLRTSQQATACLATLRRVWPDPRLETLSELLSDLEIAPVLSVVLGVRAARQDIPAALVLPAFLQSYLANLVTAGVRLIPLGQTDGQLAIAELEEAVLAVASQAERATIHDLGSAAFMVDLASASHETQYTRLFRS